MIYRAIKVLGDESWGDVKAFKKLERAKMLRYQKISRGQVPRPWILKASSQTQSQTFGTALCLGNPATIL